MHIASYVYSWIIAQYGCGNYGSSGYNDCSTTAGGGSLSDTGTGAIIGVIIGILLLLIATYLLARKLHNKKKGQAAPAEKKDPSLAVSKNDDTLEPPQEQR